MTNDNDPLHATQPTAPPPLPARLAARPVDPRRGLPIPYVNEDEDGNADFAMIQGSRAMRCAAGNLCSLCGQPNEEQIAFVGGPEAFAGHIYTDPPGHLDCMRAAVTSLCPFLSVERHRRRRDLDMPDVDEAAFTEMDKSAPVILAVTTQYTNCLLGDPFDSPQLLFLPGEWIAAHRFTYTGGRLTEDGPEPLT